MAQHWPRNSTMVSSSRYKMKISFSIVCETIYLVCHGFWVPFCGDYKRNTHFQIYMRLLYGV
jgi:hypothetical protein